MDEKNLTRMHTSPHDPENKNAEFFCHGHLEALHNFVAMCDLMKEQLWDTGKKFRVTIECDPETGRFTLKHEDLD